MDRTDIIDLYLKGLLHGEELDKFLLELKENEALAEDIEIKRQIIQAIKEVRHEQLKNYIAKNTKENAIIPLPGPKWAYGLAASVLLLAVAFFLFQDQIPKNVNPIAIFQPKDSGSSDIENDTVSIDEETVKTENVTPKVVEEVDEYDSLNEPEFITKRDDYDIPEVLDDIEIRQDQMIRTQNVIARYHTKTILNDSASDYEAIKPSTKDKIETESELKKEVKTLETKSPVASSNEKINRDDLKKVKPVNIQIEFWQSIVSYKGYKWNGKTLRLYGVDSTSTVEVHQLDNNYYLQINKDYYFLKLTDNYESYVKITDALLIERLKK